MTLLRLPELSVPDIERLKQRKDIPGIIRLLRHKDPTTQRHAAEALGTFGSKATPLLIEALLSSDGATRLGAVEALGIIRDVRAVGPLTRVLHDDNNTEVRWAAVLALGETGSSDAIPPLVRLLRDDNRYIRYGAATALVTLNWQPDDDSDRIYHFIAFQDWNSVRAFGTAATIPLEDIFRDKNPDTRSAIVSLLGEIGGIHSQTTCPKALTDRNSYVRWKAVLASMNCGVPSNQLPLMLAERERTGPDPLAAALLNFLFLGLGYNYIGKWWGFPVFMSYMSVIVLAQLAIGPFLPYLIAYPVTAVFAVMTYYQAQRIPESV